jgi:two-component system NtrC family sensor kinase
VNRDFSDYASVITEHAPMGLILADSDGVVVQVNPATLAIFGAPGADVLQGELLSDSPLLAVLVCQVNVIDIIHEGKTVHSSASGLSEWGVEIKCDTTFIPLTQSSSAPDAVLIILQDVKEKVALEHHLFKAEKLAALSNVVGGIAHEMNNPLTSILGYAELLSALENDKKKKSKLGRIIEEADRCRIIVRNLLTFSQQRQTAKMPVNMNTLLEETIALRAYQLKSDQVAILLDLQQDMPQARIHIEDMQRVFLNLINNAHQVLKNTRESDRRLRINTCRQGNSLRIVFSDNGSGIPDDIQDKVFDPFFTTHKLGDGIGLGLSVVYGIIQEHEGEVAVESVENEGTAVIIDLPLNDNSA